MFELSAFKAELKQLNASLNANLSYKGGDKLEIGNLTYIVVINADPEKKDDVMVVGAKKLASQKKRTKSINRSTEIILSPYLGIIGSHELPGTRVNIEFAFTNNLNRPVAIKGMYSVLNDKLLHFKSFFKVNADGSREPDFSARLPIVINAKGSGKLSVVLENFEQSMIKKGRLKGELIVLVGNNKVSRKKFTFNVNEAMINTLKGIRQIAEKNKVAVVFDAMIKS